MYLHLGQDTVVKVEDIIGIFDLENATISKHTRAYLAAAEKRGQVVNVSSEMPKSFCVCKGKEDTRVYISQISSVTLKRRTGFIDSIANI